MNTQQLRTQIKAQRIALDSRSVKATSQLIADQLGASEEFQQAQHIAYYLPVSGEADPTLLPTQWKSENKIFYLPVLKKTGNIGLDFIRINEDSEFKANQYGILEPLYNSADIIKPEALDLVITPLVSFDKYRNRVGMGGGFYDRTFAFKKAESITKPLLIGYAYEFQRSDKLIAETWDVKLDAIVTEKGFIRR